jgi:hypothetical protein
LIKWPIQHQHNQPIKEKEEDPLVEEVVEEEEVVTVEVVVDVEVVEEDVVEEEAKKNLLVDGFQLPSLDVSSMRSWSRS